MSRARASGEKVADRTKWDATSRTYANPDGTWTTEVSPSTINYRDAKGGWQPIETRLIASSRPGFAAESAAGSAKVLVPDDAASSPVRLEDEKGGWLTYRMKDAHGAPRLEEASATIADGPGNSVVRIDSMPWGVKETITLSAAPEVAPVYSYDLRLSADLTPTLTKHNEIVVTDRQGGERFRVTAPFMQDASSGFDDTSTAVPQILEKTASGWRLTMRPDREWLTDPARVYPVAIDPTTTVGALRDTFMVQDEPSTTHNGTWLRVGSDGGATGTNRRSLIQFRLPSTIPAKATVTSSTLDLYLVSWLNTSAAHYAVRAMKPAGSAGGTDWNSNATWDRSGTGTSWSGAGTYYFGSGPDRYVGAGAGYRSWDVRSTVADWLANPANSNGFLIKTVSEPGPNELRFVSSAGGTESQRPTLTIEWTTEPPTITAGSLVVSPSLPSGGVVARSLTPTLTATAKDTDSLEVQYRFEILNSANAVIASTPAGSSKANSNPPGSSLQFSYAVPAGVLAEGGAYTARFRAWDETTSMSAGPSISLPFRVDQTPVAPTELAVDPVSATTPILTTPVIDPELSAVVTDPGSTSTVTAKFELREVLATGGFGPVIDLGADDVDSGSRAAVTVPPEGPESLTPGKTYEFRVGAQDAVDQAQTSQPIKWSTTWTRFKVDEAAQASVPLQLAEPLTVWHNGPDISWTPYRDPSSAPGDDLAKYQIFRSCRTLPNGACTTPVDTYQQAGTPGLEEIAVLEPGETDFRDRSALPSSPTEAATYRYWVVAQTVDDAKVNQNGATASNSRDVTTPHDGRVRRIINQGVTDATISKTRPTVANSDVLQAGNAHATDGVQRGLLEFDVSVINPGMRITNASVQVRKTNTGAAGAFALHEITGKDFVEGQVTWNQASTTDTWATPGGDLAATALGQVTTSSVPGAVTYADSSTMRAAVQKWVNDRAANHGVAIRAVDESAGTQRWLDMVPAQSTQLDPTTLTETRPRLVIEHMTTSTLETFSAPDLPQRYIPNTNVTVPVTITNTTESDWPAGLQLSYRWTKVADSTTSNGTQKADLFPGSNSTRGLKSGESVTVQLIVAPPINSDTGNSRETLYDLQLDLWRTSVGAWWTSTAGGGNRYYQESELSAAQRQARDELLADNVCAMMPDGLKCPRRVIEAPSSTELGLEKFASYATEATGSGSALLTNLNTGNLAWSYDAMANPSVGPSFFARVAYNSKDASTNTGMGYGWSVQPGTLSRLNAPMVLSGSDYKAVRLTDGDGTEHGWSNPTTVGTVTTYERPAGIHLDLTKDTSKPDDEFYRFTRPDGTKFFYHRISLLPTKVRDISGNTLTYTYTSGKLTSVTDAKGRTVATLGYAGERIAWIRDISGRGLKFEYSVENPDQLAKIRDGGPFNSGSFETGAEVKDFGFTYATSQANQHSVLTRVTDPRNSATTIGYYEGTSDTYPSNPGESVPSWVMGKVRSWTDRTGQSTEVEYYDSLKLPSGATMPAGAARYSRLFDRGLSTPELTTYGIDAYGRTIELKDANATAPGAPADRADDVTRLGWDADHNVVRHELPNGAISRWQFDPKTGFPKRTWDPEAVRTGGKPTVMTYHPATSTGAVMLKSVTSPLGHTSEFGIDTAGRLTSVKDAEGGDTGYTYNPADGTVATATDPLGNKTTYAYPAATLNVGYPTLITPPTAIKAPGDDAPDAPTSFVYDERGNVRKTTTTATVGGATRTLETLADYDTFGRPKVVTSPGAQGGSRTTRYTYDLNDNQLTVEAPNGALTTTTYFPDDQAKTSTLPDNGSGTRMVAFGYDALGRLCREIAPKAGATSASCPSSSSTVPPAYATDYRYDHVGQVLSTTGHEVVDGVPTQLTTSYDYDNVGNVTGVRDPKMNRAGSTGWTAEAVYDLAGRQTTLIDALGYSTRTVYDADSNVVRTIDQAGKVKKLTYDKAGRNKTVTVSYTPPGGDPQELTTTKCYDLAGNLVKVIRPRSPFKDCAATSGLFSQTKYDENNRPFQRLSAFDPSDPDAVYQKPTSTFLRYDALGRMSAQSQPTNSDTAPAMTAVKEWARFTHFDSGEIATSVDPTGITTGYEYDLIGKQTKRTLTGAKADGTPSTATRTMTWVYNKDGSLQSRVDATSESTSLVADNGDGETTRAGVWTTVKPAPGSGQHGVNYLAHAAGSSDHVTWKVTPADSGRYRVEFSCPSPAAGEPAGSRTASASYSLSAGAATFTRSGDQTGCSGGWRALGDPVELDATTAATLKLTPGAAGVTVADAVRLVAVDAKRQYSYVYDRNGQQEQVTDDRPGSRVSKFATAYDVLGRVGSVKEYGATNPLLAMRQTLYSYDANSNVTKVEASRQVENASVDGRGSLGASTTTSYAWDARNLVDKVTQQIGTGTARTWDYEWNSRGLLERLTKPNAAGVAGAGNVVSYRYFDNGLLRDKIEKKPGAEGFVTSSHALTYNEDGDPVRDISQVQRVNTATWRKQVIKYAYSPTQALRSVDKTGEKPGDDEAYKYDVAGNTVYSTIGKTTTASKYDGTRLTEATATTCPTTAPCTADTGGVSSTSMYVYDDFGRLTSVSNDKVESARASYVYDGFDRVVGETHGELSKTTAYDPFDRVTVQNVTKSGTSKKTRFNYLGTSEQVAAEERWDTGTSAWKQVKAYGYGPDGKPLVMQSTPITGEVKTRFYSTSTHGDTEALTDPDTGNVTAAYRYTAYGAPDTNDDNKGEDPVAQKGDTSNPADPTKDALNPYRYSSKRIDSATGDYDMGFRNYSPGLNRFTTRDMYNGALSDMKLGMDPWNTNRYVFAGGNPITRIEYDGHRAVDPEGNEIPLDGSGPDTMDILMNELAGGHGEPATEPQATVTSNEDDPQVIQREPDWTKLGLVGTFGAQTFASEAAASEAAAARALAARGLLRGAGALSLLFLLSGDSIQNQERRIDFGGYRDACYAGATRGASVYYFPLNESGAATGAMACLKGGVPVGLRDNRTTFTPPGFKRGSGMHRGHLIARMLGGSNVQPGNIVPLFGRANREMLYTQEYEIAAAVSTQTVFYTAVPVYSAYVPDGGRVPLGVQLTWAGSEGAGGSVFIRNYD